MPPREISPAPLPTTTHSYQLEIGSKIGFLASDQRAGNNFFFFLYYFLFIATTRHRYGTIEGHILHQNVSLP
jgi:hypothetical protein